LATMSCQNSLSSVALMSWIGLTLSSKHVHRLSKYFCLCRPIARLPSTFPVTTSASKPFLIIIITVIIIIIVINKVPYVHAANSMPVSLKTRLVTVAYPDKS